MACSISPFCKYDDLYLMVFTNSRRQAFSFYTVQIEDEDDRARELPLLEISSESAIDIRNEIYKGPLQEYIEECSIFKSLNNMELYIHRQAWKRDGFKGFEYLVVCAANWKYFIVEPWVLTLWAVRLRNGSFEIRYRLQTCKLQFFSSPTRWKENP